MHTDPGLILRGIWMGFRVCILQLLVSQLAVADCICHALIVVLCNQLVACEPAPRAKAGARRAAGHLQKQCGLPPLAFAFTPGVHQDLKLGVA